LCGHDCHVCGTAITKGKTPVPSRASSPRADCEASRERLGAEVRKRELATITEEISFPLPLREGEYHWLKNDKLSINNH